MSELSPSLTTTLLLFLAAGALRRYLPAGHQHRARMAAMLILGSGLFGLATLAIAELAIPRAELVVVFFAELSLWLGAVVLLHLFSFDLVLERARVHVPGVLRDAILATAFLVIPFVLLAHHGVDILPLVTTSAVLTAVVGLALQNTISNLFAGLSLQLDRSFAIGDWIQVGSRVGRISQIKWRSTSIVTRDNDVLVVPNGQLTTDEVLNLSGPSRPHRVHLKVAFHYRHPPNEVSDVLIGAVRGVPGVLEAPPPSCVPCDFADSGITYLLNYWIDDHARDIAIDGEARTRIWYAARRASLEIPYPIRSVFVTTQADTAPASELAERLALIAQIDLFQPLEEGERRLLAERMRAQDFARGEVIIRRGEPGDSLFLVKSGRVAVMVEQGDQSRRVATLGPRDFFGEMSLLTGEPRAATCAADSDVVAYVVDHESFRLVLEAKPALVDDISSILGLRAVALRAKEVELQPGDDDPTPDGEKRKVMARIRAFFHLAR